MVTQDVVRFFRIIKEEGLKEAADRTVGYLKLKYVSHASSREWMSLQPQERLLDSLFEDDFTLIIFDACRYDYFLRNYQNYCEGDLQAARSPASWTSDWIKVVCAKRTRQLRGVKVFSANPMINSKGIGVSRLLRNKVSVIDIWDVGWDTELGTVHPYTVVEAVKKNGLESKNIIWFIQPHWPYVGKTKLLFPKEVTRSSLVGASRYVARKVRAGEISREELSMAYADNLKLVLEAVNELLTDVAVVGRTVITSDHGELLGEYDAYLHPSYLSFPEQRVVPWLEVD